MLKLICSIAEVSRFDIYINSNLNHGVISYASKNICEVAIWHGG